MDIKLINMVIYQKLKSLRKINIILYLKNLNYMIFMV